MPGPAITIVDLKGDTPSILTCDLIVQKGAVQSVQLLSLDAIYQDVDVLLPGLPGKAGADGDPGKDGNPGKDGIATILETPYGFPIAAKTWTIQHDLGRRPNVRVLTGDGTRIYPSIRDLDANVVEIGFYWPMSGMVYIS